MVLLKLEILNVVLFYVISSGMFCVTTECAQGEVTHAKRSVKAE